MAREPVARDLSVGEVARRSGVAVSTIHFYEAKGLIRGWRSAGNQRRYPRGVLRRVAVIRVAQRTGIPLTAIGAALEALPDDRPPSAEDWRRLDSCIGCGCLSLTECPLRNPQDALGDLGTGPRLLEP